MMEQKKPLEKNPGFFRELGEFMIQSKKWWLIPVIIATLLMGGLIMLGGTAAAPFIYTLF